MYDLGCEQPLNYTFCTTDIQCLFPDKHFWQPSLPPASLSGDITSRTSPMTSFQQMKESSVCHLRLRSLVPGGMDYWLDMFWCVTTFTWES
jgi:hypothetical protein